MLLLSSFLLSLVFCPTCAWITSTIRNPKCALRSNALKMATDDAPGACRMMTTFEENPVPNMLDGAFSVTIAKDIGSRKACAKATSGQSMEDEAFVARDFACVMDGHGGGGVSNYVCKNLYNELIMALASEVGEPFKDVADIDEESINGIYAKAAMKDFEAALRSSLATINTHCFGVEEWRITGTTVNACWIVPSDEGYMAMMCNIGDRRGVLYAEEQATFRTVDHKPNHPIEKARIEEAGGSIYEKGGIWRVEGGLAMSRAIGDWEDSPFVGAEPDIVSFPVPDKGFRVVLATDGFWDVLGESSASSGNANSLVLEALYADTQDNVAVVVLETAATD